MRLRRRTHTAATAAALCAAALFAGCTSSTDSSASTGVDNSPGSKAPLTSASHPTSRPASGHSTAPTSSKTSSGAPHAAPDAAHRVLATMTLAQRVGQLIMVDCPSSGVASATVTAVHTHHVGSVILDGNSTLGVTATRRIANQLQAITPSAPRLFIATDQEGGLVQRMKGSGFSTIPSALAQGSLAPATLRADSTRWGRQLRSAGLNVDLAPVLDTVPSGGGSNPPIGDLDREYGHTPAAVSSHGVAVAQGLAAAGVAATVKHFPGLGRVRGNTDTTSGVTDTVTTRHDAYLAPFAAAVKAHVSFVMMSTAIYSRIAPGVPAAFSRTIVTGILRGDLGFHGIVITDDVGAARQVSGYSPGQRAVAFVAAGGTIVLTVAPSVVASMTSALIAKANASPAFRAKVSSAALVVLEAKSARKLL